jgi:hypothetical protein
MRNSSTRTQHDTACPKISAGTSGQVEIRLSSRARIDPVALGKRRLDFYNRTLG